MNKACTTNELCPSERLYYRDQLRAARYAALADAEGFHSICFALEALGMRLLGHKEALGSYKDKLRILAQKSTYLDQLPSSFPELLKDFDALFKVVKNARNDAMHTGAYARHATAAAIELCIGLEHAIMVNPSGADAMDLKDVEVKDLMVKSPVIVESWQPVAHARQLMLTHSFSCLPVKIGDDWKLITEMSLARYLSGSNTQRNTRIANSIQRACACARACPDSLQLIDAVLVDPDEAASGLLTQEPQNLHQTLWLVKDGHGGICGVLSPFELM